MQSERLSPIFITIKINIINNMKIHKLKDDNGILAQTKEILPFDLYEDLLKTLSELEDNECYKKKSGHIVNCTKSMSERK